MSCIRYFNGTPHVVRYGMQDDKKEQGWMIFWRNGVKFKISVDGSDVLGTRFYEKWRELNQEPGTIGSPRDWVHRWELLCDCIISQCLDLLEELAPVGLEYWKTLKEYLHTPGYELRVVADEELGDAKGVKVSGPKVDGAYELGPLPADEIELETDGLQEYQSTDLRVIDREVNWRTPPHRVQTFDGTCFALKHVDTYSKWGDTGEIINFSLDTIRLQMQIHEHCRHHPLGYPDRIPQVLGYATDETDLSENRGIETRAHLLANSEPKPASKVQTLVAGILVTDFPHFRTLWDLVRDAKTDRTLFETIDKHHAVWYLQTQAIVSDLHAHGMACDALDHGDGVSINQMSIHIDNELKVWLDPPVHHFLPFDAETAAAASPSSSSQEARSPSDPRSEFEAAKERDLQAIRKLFLEWLPAELDKIRDAMVAAESAGEKL